MDLKEASKVAYDLIGNIERVIVGKYHQILLVVTMLFSKGHLLIEDDPEVAKTMLARAISQNAS